MLSLLEMENNCISGWMFDYLHARQERKMAPLKMRSMLNLMEEKDDASCSKTCLITSSTFDMVWNCIILVMLCLTIIFVPLQVAFMDKNIAFIVTFEVVVDIFFFMDIIFNFITPYSEYGTGRIIKNHKAIAKHYITHWFFFDLFALIPLHQFKAFRVIRFIRIIRFIKFFKLIRIYRYKKKVKKITSTQSIMYHGLYASWFRLARMFFVLFAYAHVLACFWYFAGDIDGESWISNFQSHYVEREEFSSSYMYSASLYWAVSTLTTVGYGDITVVTQVEILIAGITMLSSITFLTYLTGAMDSLISNYDASDENDASTAQKMLGVERFAKTLQLPQKVRRELFKYERHIDQSAAQAKLSDLFYSEEERRRVLPFLFKEIFDNCPLLIELKQGLLGKDCWAMFSSQLALRLSARSLHSNKYICDENAPVKTMYIVASNGTIRSSTNHLFKRGSCPGFAAFVLFGVWQFDLITEQATKVFTIKASDFLELLEKIELMAACDHGARCLPRIPDVLNNWASKQEYANPNKAQTLGWKSIGGLKANLEMVVHRSAQKAILSGTGPLIHKL